MVLAVSNPSNPSNPVPDSGKGPAPGTPGSETPEVPGALRAKNSGASPPAREAAPLPSDSGSLDLRTTLAFGFGAMTDQMSHQAFQFLIFTFYYAVVGVNVNVLAAAFVIFAVWDSVNDPLIGPISDRTTSKLGRRRFWVLVSLVPFALANVFLFTPPGRLASDVGNAVYMILIIMVYDLVYTIFSTQQLALFPEMFKTEASRGRANLYKNVLTIVGVLVGFVLPTVLINPMAPAPDATPAETDEIAGMYLNTGILVAVLVVVFGVVFLRFGIQEDPAHQTKPETMPGLWTSLKQTLGNKAFVIFVVGNMFNWFVFKLLTTIVPLYGIHVLGIEEGNFLLTAILLVALLTAAAFFPVMEKLGHKLGMRNAFLVSETVFLLSLIPYAFLDNQPGLAIVAMIFTGIGISGQMYFVDILIGNIIDEDEVRNGCRREGSFYGINALINRYSTILVFVAIAAVLTGYGWEEYLVGAGADFEALRAGLKLLMTVFTMAGVAVMMLCLKYYPLHGERLREVQAQVETLRDRKMCTVDE